MQNQVIESSKKSLIDDLSKRLLELEFKSNHSIKSKCLKWIVKNIFTKLQKMKNKPSEIKPIKIGKRPGITYCFGCKHFTHNFRSKNDKQSTQRKIKLLFVDQISRGF